MPEDDFFLFFTIFCKAQIRATDDTSGHKMVDFYYLNRGLSRSLILSKKASLYLQAYSCSWHNIMYLRVSAEHFIG